MFEVAFLKREQANSSHRPAGRVMRLERFFWLPEEQTRRLVSSLSRRALWCHVNSLFTSGGEPQNWNKNGIMYPAAKRQKTKSGRARCHVCCFISVTVPPPPHTLFILLGGRKRKRQKSAKSSTSQAALEQDALNLAAVCFS